MLAQSQALENFQRNTAYATANYNRTTNPLYVIPQQYSGMLTGAASSMGYHGATYSPTGEMTQAANMTFGGQEMGSYNAWAAEAGMAIGGVANVAGAYQSNEQVIADRLYAIEASGAEFTQAVQRNTQMINDEWLNLQIAFPYSANLQIYYGNDFQLTATHLSDNDVARFDLWLHQFGYATSEKFASSHLNNRTHFNFIKVDMPLIKTGYGSAIDSTISEILSNGVRIWHTLPTVGAMLIGGN